MRKLIKRTAITALALTVGAVGSVYLPFPVNYSGKDTVSVTEYFDDGLVVLSNESEYKVELESFDAAKKIPVIKAVRAVTGLGLGEAKALVERAVNGNSQLVKDGLNKTDADDIVRQLNEAGGKAVRIDPVGAAPGNNTSGNNTFVTGSGSIFDRVSNWISVNDGRCKPFIDLDCEEAVVYEVRVTNLTDEALDMLANAYVLEISEWIKDIEEHRGCGYVMEPDRPDLGIEEKFGIPIQLLNAETTETPEIMPLGSSDLTSGNGITATPLSKVPGKKQLLAMIGPYLNGKVNFVYASKAEAEEYVKYLKDKYQAEAEITPFSRLSYEGKTFNWVPSSNFETEYDNMISAINDGTARFGTCWTDCYNWSSIYVPTGPAAGSGSVSADEEPVEFTVTLKSFDAAKKIPVIKAVREITGLGLGEAKALVESVPKVLKEGVSKADADEIIKKIEQAGGKASKDGCSTSVSFTNQSETNLTLLSNQNETTLTLLSNESEVNDWSVTLTSFDASKKIPVIKAIREVTGLGLGEAKALVEGAPRLVKGNLSKADAEEIAKKIEEAGGSVETKGTEPTQGDSAQDDSAQTVGTDLSSEKTAFFIKSYDPEKEAELISAVAGALDIEEYQAENIVKYNQIVKSVYCEENATKTLNKIDAAFDGDLMYDYNMVQEEIVKFALPQTSMPGSAAGAGAGYEEQTEFTVTLESFDPAKKIAVIKAVKAMLNIGLGEAKALVEGAPKALKDGVSKADADAMIKQIEEAGGKASKK